jgi:hypothetical protein
MSSLTHRGPHTVTCIPKVVVGKDRTGSNKLGPGTPKTYQGVTVEPTGLAAFGQAEDVRSGGMVVNADYQIMKALEPRWVGGPHSTIVWEGVEYDQVGEARTYSRGRMTKHQVIKMKARGVEVR